jgi:hypothetical protein
LIKQVEASFISKCKGAIIFGTPYDGSAFKYDIKSMYPSIQASTIKFPIDEGEILYLTNDEFHGMKYYKYGIYRVKVYKSDADTNKLFRFNPEHYYTHTDLEVAKEIGLKYELIVDNQPNFIHYSRDKLMCGSEIFGEFVNTMFDYKQRKLPRSKGILNILWGKLTQRNIKKEVIFPDGPAYKIHDDAKIVRIRPSNINEDENIIEYVYNDSMYCSGWARIGVFLISKGKSMISKIMQPYKHNVIKCHTDGFCISKNPVGLATGNELGNLAFEGYAEHCIIKNSMSLYGDFKI